MSWRIRESAYATSSHLSLPPFPPISPPFPPCFRISGFDLAWLRLRRALRNRHLRIQIHTLDRVQQRDAFAEGPLEGFSSADQSHAAGALVDDRRRDRFLHVVLAGCAAAVDEA